MLLAVRMSMDTLRKFEVHQETRVALGCVSSNSDSSFVLSKPSRMHLNSIYASVNHFLLVIVPAISSFYEGGLCLPRSCELLLYST